MLEKAKNKLIKYLNRHSEGHEDLETPSGIKAEFELKYKSLTVGYLELNDGVWKFSYSDEFKEQDELRPIVQFPDTSKVYENEELWPFFTIRIPGLNQPEIEHILESENIDRSNEVELLKRFGEKTISNPYELVGAA
ncbi:HipA N-terminal domain-containing protein [Halalkalibaculum sp. DA3122]|uniref:HipA N-terminal domain-containing protein n=1 Tax=Halalkalibaculum sp. DA3122 TaxID=3373607 RepID=UPI0037547668